jgi:enamine deaminase RidA (YjgF/YER057c/UK114 family)
MNPPGLYDPSPYCYSHVAVLREGCRTVCVSGQGGENETGELSPDFRTQVRQALRNLQTALKAAGAGAADVAKLTVLIVDHTEDKLRLLGSELTEAFGEGPKPACTLIPVPRLALDAMLVEIEAVAAARA